MCGFKDYLRFKFNGKVGKRNEISSGDKQIEYFLRRYKLAPFAKSKRLYFIYTTTEIDTRLKLTGGSGAPTWNCIECFKANKLQNQSSQ